MIFVKKGWLEYRRSERDRSTLPVDYRVIPPNGANQAKNDENYYATPVKGDLIATTAHLFQIHPNSLLQPGPLFCTKDAIQPNGLLELAMKVPRWEAKVRYLVQVQSVKQENELKEVIHMTNLRILAAHKGDLKDLTDAIRGAKG